jgi:hypothetical protein
VHHLLLVLLSAARCVALVLPTAAKARHTHCPFPNPRRAQEKKEKKAGAKDARPPAGDVEGASIEELNQKVVTLEREKNKEEEYRNYMQLERVGAATGCCYTAEEEPPSFGRDCSCLLAASRTGAFDRGQTDTLQV